MCRVASVHAALHTSGWHWGQYPFYSVWFHIFFCQGMGGRWPSTWIQLAWCPWKPLWPPHVSHSHPLYCLATPEVSKAQAASARCVLNTTRDTTNKSVCAMQGVNDFYPGPEFSHCFLSFIEYLNKQNIWESVPSLHTLFPILSLRSLWSHRWHNSSISKPNITVSTSEAHWLCAAEGYVGVCDVFLNVKILFVFNSPYLCLGIHTRVRQQRLAGLSVHFAHLCICMIVQLVRLSALPSNPPPFSFLFVILVDSCHVFEAITPLLRLMRFIFLLAWIRLLAPVCTSCGLWLSIHTLAYVCVSVNLFV